MNRFYSLLALLFMGSVSLQAQDDPFGDFNPRLYQSNMTITAQVVQNGNVVTDGIVAVYCRDELRGKKNVGNDPNHPDLVYLQVYANSTGVYDQYLHFKVYTGGCIFTFTPDPAIYWKNNASYGTTSTPYIIDITPVSLVNDADNTTTLTTWKDKTCDVALTDRTLYRDGAWNTLCLPFGLDGFTGTPLEGATVKTLVSTDFADGTLTMYFENASTVEAGTPYIVKWEKPDGYDANPSNFDISNPLFTGVTISNATTNISTSYVDFMGTYSPVNIYTEEKTNLYLGSASTLYYPIVEGYKVNACRAYFQLKQGLTAGDPVNGIKAFVLNFGGTETGVESLSLAPSLVSEGSVVEWYSLDGCCLSSKPTQRGIYIHGKRKVVIP